MHAVRRGELEVVKILVEKGGADVNISEKVINNMLVDWNSVQ